MKSLTPILLFSLLTLVACEKEDPPSTSDHFTATIEGQSFSAHTIEIDYNVKIIITGTDTVNGNVIRISSDQLDLGTNLSYGLKHVGYVKYNGVEYFANEPDEGSLSYFESNSSDGPLSAKFTMVPHLSTAFATTINVENGSFYKGAW
jgi:hypothetical protein